MATYTLSLIYAIPLTVGKWFCMSNREYLFGMKDYSFFGFEFAPPFFFLHPTLTQSHSDVTHGYATTRAVNAVISNSGKRVDQWRPLRPSPFQTERGLLSNVINGPLYKVPIDLTKTHIPA